jgi:hypothetical protein
MVEPVASPEVGRFVWDDHGFWLGSIDLPDGNSGYFTIRVPAARRAEVLPLARAAVVRARDCEAEVRRFAAAELLGRPASSAKVQRAADELELSEVSVNADGGLEFSYEDRDLVLWPSVVWLDSDGHRGVAKVE